jgi:predicted ATPase
VEKHRVNRLRAEGWKSFRSLDLTFGDCTVFIGSNGAGKSNLIAIFDFFRAITERRLKTHSLAIGGANEILHYGPKHTRRLRIQIEFANSLDYDMALVPIHEGMLGVDQDSYTSEDPALIPATKLSPLDPAFSPLESVYVWNLEALDRPRTYQFHDTSTHSRIRGFADIHQTQYLHEDGGNLAAILWQMRRTHPAHFLEIERHAQAVIPGFSHLVLDPARESKDEVRLEWLGSMTDYPMSPNQLSDGSLRWLALSTLLLQPAEWAPGVILLDEPELGLHPHALERLAGMVQAASCNTQVVLATQSPFLLNFFSPEQVITIDHDGRESSVRRHDSTSLNGWLKDYSMGELWEKNLLGGLSHA